jgi:hypothetical protein
LVGFFLFLTSSLITTIHEKSILIGAILTIYSVAAAQKPNMKKSSLAFSAGADLAVPFSFFGDNYSVGYGVSLQADFWASQKIALGL